MLAQVVFGFLVASAFAQHAQTCTQQGIQPMTRGACESRYIQCVDVGLEAIVFECASSDTRYDVISEACLMPEFVEACGGYSTTTTPVPQADPTVAPFGFDCSNKRDIDFPHPNKPCSSIYVSCSGGDHFFRRCAEETKFDVISRKCLEDRFVKTCHGTATTIAPEEETTQAEPDTRCVGKADGMYAEASGSCSPVILTCNTEIAVSLLCPEGLRFDTISEECRKPEWVVACGGQATTTGKPLPPQFNPAPAEQVAFCATKETDGSYAYPSECSAEFITCVAGTPIVYKCPAKLRYSVEENACLKARDVASCSQFDAMPSNVCGGKVDGFYAHPADCHKFFYCDNSAPLELDCAGDLVFDANHMKCDNPDKVMETSCGKIAEADVPEFNCNGLAVGFYTNAHDCSSYFLCEENGSAWSFQCEAGFAFDKAAEECRPAAQVGECMPPRLPEMKSFCKSQARNGVFEHPTECPSGLICLQDVAFELTCMREKPAFDKYLLQCVHTLTAEGQCAAK